MNQHRYLRKDADDKPIPINDQVKIGPAHLVTRCTRQLVDEIALDIAKGGTPHIVAAAHGVTPARFREWLRLGHIAAENDDLEDPHGYLYVAVFQAAGLARQSAEQWVWRTDPPAWLAYTLGRDAMRAGVQSLPDASHDPSEGRAELIRAEMGTSGRRGEVVAMIREFGLDRLVADQADHDAGIVDDVPAGKEQTR